jgi:hypothetical protein
LLANGPLTHVSGTTSWNSPLLSNGSVSTFPWQRLNPEKQNNRGTVRHGDLYSVRLEVSSVQEILHSVFERAFNDSFVTEFSVQLWSVNQRTTEAEEVTDS